MKVGLICDFGREAGLGGGVGTEVGGGLDLLE